LRWLILFLNKPSFLFKSHNYLLFIKKTGTVSVGRLISRFVFVGYFLVFGNKKWGFKSVLYVAFATTFAIETSQLFTDRISDINDIISNIIGGLVGYSIYMLINKNYTEYYLKRLKSSMALYVKETIRVSARKT